MGLTSRPRSCTLSVHPSTPRTPTVAGTNRQNSATTGTKTRKSVNRGNVLCGGTIPQKIKRSGGRANNVCVQWTLGVLLHPKTAKQDQKSLRNTAACRRIVRRGAVSRVRVSAVRNAVPRAQSCACNAVSCLPVLAHNVSAYAPEDKTWGTPQCNPQYPRCAVSPLDGGGARCSAPSLRDHKAGRGVQCRCGGRPRLEGRRESG